MLRRRDRSAVGNDAGELNDMRARVSAAEAALEALSEGIVVFDRAGRMSSSNAAARELIGRRFASVRELGPPVLRDAL